MCGIGGFVNFNGGKVERALIETMISAVNHRGPDGAGVLVEANVGLGHSRLAIIDLSADGAQPMTDSAGHYSVVFNGEIYNYRELRLELQTLGHVFSTLTDTEVLLAAYSEWGVSCVNHFNGMWSFALYDRVRSHLFCSRDRFGEKPFYFMRNEDCFAFGSEIRQLLPLLGKKRVNHGSLLKFLIGAPSEDVNHSFFEDVHKIPGGHNLILNLHTGNVSIDRYYEVKFDHSLANIDEREAVELFSNVFRDSISLRLRADVRVGTCLSGGLDSSSIATLASEIYSRDSQQSFEAITACSEQSDNDESNFAAQVVDCNQLLWHKVRPSYDDFSVALPKVVEAQEEPFPSASIVMQYFVMQTARQNGIPVLLDGQGGDETLLGYERYFAPHFLQVARSHGWLNAISAMRASSVNNASMSLPRMLGYFAYFTSASLRWSNYRRRNSYLREFPEMFDEIRLYADASADIQLLQKLEIERTNLPALLRYEDKNAMRHSIETRLPFLDYRLVELSLSLPGSAKISDGWTKHVLRKSMQDKMPESVIWRRNKLGFEAPERLWFSRHRDSMLDAVRNSKLLASLCLTGPLIRDFNSLNALTQWRLYSVACWERAFEVEI
jgi:asparagine synthase (glutamine-hydrolysing)